MITAEGLHQLAGIIEATPELQRDARLQEGFTEGRLTICSDMDIPGQAKPVYQGQGFDLYLVDASQECACLTNDLDSACGVVLALHEEDED